MTDISADAIETRPALDVIGDGPASLDIRVAHNIRHEGLKFPSDTIRMNRARLADGSIEFASVDENGQHEPLFYLSAGTQPDTLVLTDSDKGASGTAVVIAREILAEIARPDAIGVSPRAHLAQHEIPEPKYLATHVQFVTTCFPLINHFADRAVPTDDGFIIEVNRTDAFKIGGVTVGQTAAVDALKNMGDAKQ